MKIRPAEFSDIPVITRIYAHAVKRGTASFELEAPDEAEMTRRMKSVLDGGFPYIAAEAEGITTEKVIGALVHHVKAPASTLPL